MIYAHFFCPNTINAHFFVAKMIWAHFFVAKTIYAHFFVAKTIYAFFFVAKTIYALCPESFCALKVAIRKVQTFWASGEGGVSPHSPDRKQMWNFWPNFSLKFDSLILITHFIALWWVSKMHFHVLNASAILLSDHFVTEQQQAVWRNSELL